MTADNKASAEGLNGKKIARLYSKIDEARAEGANGSFSLYLGTTDDADAEGANPRQGERPLFSATEFVSMLHNSPELLDLFTANTRLFNSTRDRIRQLTLLGAILFNMRDDATAHKMGGDLTTKLAGLTSALDTVQSFVSNSAMVTLVGLSDTKITMDDVVNAYDDIRNVLKWDSLSNDLHGLTQYARAAIEKLEALPDDMKPTDKAQAELEATQEAVDLWTQKRQKAQKAKAETLAAQARAEGTTHPPLLSQYAVTIAGKLSEALKVSTMRKAPNTIDLTAEGVTDENGMFSLQTLNGKPIELEPITDTHYAVLMYLCGLVAQIDLLDNGDNTIIGLPLTKTFNEWGIDERQKGIGPGGLFKKKEPTAEAEPEPIPSDDLPEPLPSPTVSADLPEMSRRQLRVSYMNSQIMSGFVNLLGQVPESCTTNAGALMALCSFHKYDEQTDIYEINAPFIFEMRRQVELESKEARSSYRAFVHYFYANVVSERNHAAIELANYIACRLIERGTRNPDRGTGPQKRVIKETVKATKAAANGGKRQTITESETIYPEGEAPQKPRAACFTISPPLSMADILKACPILANKLNSILAQPSYITVEGGKTKRVNIAKKYNTELERTFRDAYRIIYTKSDIPRYYVDFTIGPAIEPTRKKGETEAEFKARLKKLKPYERIMTPTKGTAKNFTLRIKHKGKNPEYQAPTTHN